MKNNTISAYFVRHSQVLEAVCRQLEAPIEETARVMARALAAGRKILVMGNGGSAADAQHLAAELVGRFLRQRRALPAIALTTDTSLLTAVANDFGFEKVFERQLEALAMAEDVVIGISTSGNSPNVCQALIAAKKIGCITIALLGRDGGAIAPLADIALTVAAQETPHIQEAHITIIHLLCQLVEQRLFDGDES